MKNTLTKDDYKKVITNYKMILNELKNHSHKGLTYKLELLKCIIMIHKIGRDYLLTENMIDYLVDNFKNFKMFLLNLRHICISDYGIVYSIDLYMDYLKDLYFYHNILKSHFPSDSELDDGYNNVMENILNITGKKLDDIKSLSILDEIIYLLMAINDYRLDININSLVTDLVNDNSFDWLLLNNLLTDWNQKKVLKRSAINFFIDNYKEEKSIIKKL